MFNGTVSGILAKNYFGLPKGTHVHITTETVTRLRVAYTSENENGEEYNDSL